MNLYVDEGYYLNEFNGTTLPEDDVEKYLRISQEKIDDITYNRIVAIGFEKLTEFQKECIRKAICYQAEYYFENGINSFTSVSSYDVLDISIDVDRNAMTEAEKQDMNEMAYLNIKKTGLTCKVLKRWL